MDDDDNVCGCGKPVRYMVSGGKYSCNKYTRCPSYNDLVESVRVLNTYLLSILKEVHGGVLQFSSTEQALDSAKKIIKRNNAAYTLYLNKGE